MDILGSKAKGCPFVRGTYCKRGWPGCQCFIEVHDHEGRGQTQPESAGRFRERIFVVGINQQLHPNKTWTPPTPTAMTLTVKDAIGHLPEPIHNDRGLDADSIAVHPNHWCLVPRSNKFESATLEQGQAYGRSFRTLSWDEPSWTVAYGHREVHVHPNGKRRLSIYEAMLLQTFPHEYKLIGNMSAQVRLVSEAVPVKLAQQIAQSIRDSLEI